MSLTDDKVCSKCKQLKKAYDFDIQKSKDGSSHLHGHCRDCRRVSQRKYGIKRQKMCPDKVYAIQARHRFGVDPEQIEKMLKDQNGVCLICGGTNPNGSRLNLDHCHKTNKVRGLLCLKCNMAIGSLNHDVEILKKAIAYLERK